MDPIIGLGTGRCGTRSLSKFLKSHGIPSNHEKYKLRWHPSFEVKERLNNILKKIKTQMDVGFYWLMYVPMVIREYTNARFICLERDKNQVIKSFLGNTGHGINPIITFLHLCRKGNEVTYYRETVSQKDLDSMDPATREFVEHMWDTPLAKYPDLEHRFPDYHIYDPEEFLNKYCDEYHEWAKLWETLYPDNFLRIELNYALNTEEGRNKILNHIGIVPDAAVQ